MHWSLIFSTAILPGETVRHTCDVTLHSLGVQYDGGVAYPPQRLRGIVSSLIRARTRRLRTPMFRQGSLCNSLNVK